MKKFFIACFLAITSVTANAQYGVLGASEMKTFRDPVTNIDITMLTDYVKSDGSDLKPLYKETPLDWVTHETFATEDYVYFNVLGFQPRLRKQAHGIFRINLRNDDIDVVGQVETSSPAAIDNQMLGGKGFWHCNASRDNRWAAGDTFAGSVWIINTTTGEKTQIASDCRMKPDHAQPFFSPDGKKLCFQSGHFTDGKRLTLMMVDLTKVPTFK